MKKKKLNNLNLNKKTISILKENGIKGGTRVRNIVPLTDECDPGNPTDVCGPITNGCETALVCPSQVCPSQLIAC
ncbi:hypothetical protein GTQ40_04705 [Flavobacteriaceae bacterium R38]|nr:hypothetical protein [Flavobacteriaceae bacterium R38]